MSFENDRKAKEPLMSGEDTDSEDTMSHRPQSPLTATLLRAHPFWATAVLIIACGLIFGMGVATGHGISRTQRGLLAPEGDTQVFMEYNSTFTLHPSPETEAAWDSLFPKGKGFVRHETIAPETSGLVVYHSLHCLKALHSMYYQALDGELSSNGSTEHSHSHMIDPHHIRHCFDYLRQGLMCSADTNLEPVSKDLKGVTGWGFVRTCRNIDSVKAWAEANWSNDV